MLGRKKCVAAVLVEMIPDVLAWHWCNHRLELAVNDVVLEVNKFCYMKRYFCKLRECARSLCLI
jgi:hypothetical protein